MTNLKKLSNRVLFADVGIPSKGVCYDTASEAQERGSRNDAMYWKSLPGRAAGPGVYVLAYFLEEAVLHELPADGGGSSFCLAKCSLRKLWLTESYIEVKKSSFSLHCFLNIIH